MTMSTKTCQAACEALWGPQYRSEAARAFGVGRSSVVRYDNGEREIPALVMIELYVLC
jgi:hypothetical protein